MHATDETNASRTLLCSLETLDWDDELLELFGVPPRAAAARSSRRARTSARASCSAARCRSQGIAGDQQAALFAAPAARRRRTAPARSSSSRPRSRAGHGVLRTAAARLEREEPRRALEGAVFVTGAAIQWLRDGLGLIDDAAESEALAASLDDNGGVYFVPALAGLGSPHWRADARGTITGLTRGTTRAHLVRAALEAAAYQTRGRARRDAAARAAARRRRHDAQPLADAVPGRRARHPGRDRARAGADRARRRAARARRAQAVARGRAVRAAAERRPLRVARRAPPNATLTSSHAVPRSLPGALAMVGAPNRKEHDMQVPKALVSRRDGDRVAGGSYGLASAASGTDVDHDHHDPELEHGPAPPRAHSSRGAASGATRRR